MNTPVVNEETGEEISDHLYVYSKNGAERMERAGVQGGTIPIRIGNKAAVEPYGWANDANPAGAGFAEYLTPPMGSLIARKSVVEGRRWCESVSMWGHRYTQK